MHTYVITISYIIDYKCLPYTYINLLELYSYLIQSMTAYHTLAMASLAAEYLAWVKYQDLSHPSLVFS